MKTTFAIGAFTVLMSGAAAFADDNVPDWIMDTSGVGKARNGVVTSSQALEMGVSSPGAVQLEGESSLRSGNLDAAISRLQKSVELAPEDIDKRTLYAQALQKKLMQQKVKDARLYNFVVKQWMFVYKRSEFIDQTLEAKQQLKQLTGTVPKPLEKASSYLSRVLLPEDSVAAK